MAGEINRDEFLTNKPSPRQRRSLRYIANEKWIYLKVILIEK